MALDEIPEWAKKVGGMLADELVGGGSFYRVKPEGRDACAAKIAAVIATHAPAPATGERLREALAKVMEWIDNWSPSFTEDEEWPATEAKARAALSRLGAEGKAERVWYCRNTASFALEPQWRLIKARTLDWNGDRKHPPECPCCLGDAGLHDGSCGWRLLLPLPPEAGHGS